MYAIKKIIVLSTHRKSTLRWIAIKEAQSHTTKKKKGIALKRIVFSNKMILPLKLNVTVFLCRVRVDAVSLFMGTPSRIHNTMLSVDSDSLRVCLTPYFLSLFLSLFHSIPTKIYDFFPFLEKKMLKC